MKYPLKDINMKIQKKKTVFISEILTVIPLINSMVGPNLYTAYILQRESWRIGFPSLSIVNVLRPGIWPRAFNWDNDSKQVHSNEAA